MSRFSEIHQVNDILMTINIYGSQAYTNLMAIQVESDERSQCDDIEFEAIIEKVLK